MSFNSTTSLLTDAMPSDSFMDIANHQGSTELSEEREPPAITDDICPNGNLVVIVDETNVKVFRVSAEHLALASKPLKAMLGPNFMEGSSRPKDKNKSWIVRLREDNGHAMHVLFSILHHDRGDVTIVGLPQLKDFAIVIEKYDCSWPVRKWTQEWTTKHFPHQPYWDAWPTYRAGNELDLLCLAFAFQDRGRFYQASQRVMFHASNNHITACESNIAEPLVAILPKGLLRALNNHRKTIIRRLQSSVEEIVISYVTDAPSCGNGNPRTELACGIMEHLGKFMRELHRCGLWPLARVFRDTSIYDILAMFEAFDIQQNTLRAGPGCLCTILSLPTCVRNLAKRPRETIRGLCLTCVKAGKFSARAGNCCEKTTHSDFPGILQDGEESEDVDFSSDEEV